VQHQREHWPTHKSICAPSEKPVTQTKTFYSPNKVHKCVEELNTFKSESMKSFTIYDTNDEVVKMYIANYKNGKWAGVNSVEFVNDQEIIAIDGATLKPKRILL
jgi:hypothetical protein